jgi:hypothetical protein
MANPIPGGAPAAPASASTSDLSSLIERVRRKLDDSVGGTNDEYLWSNDFLTDMVNEVIRDLCLSLNIIDDEITTNTCVLTLLAGASTVTISDAITYIAKARLASQDDFLTLVTASELEGAYPDWRDETADEPTHLVVAGLGDRTIRLYPPTAATDTLTLTVRRIPLADLVWDDDQGTELPIPVRFHSILPDGILAKAYRMQDVDTYNPRKAAEHEALFARGVEMVRRSLLKTDHRFNNNILSDGWM